MEPTLKSFSNNAIIAKARAMYGARLTAADYETLIHKRSVSEIAGYLKNAPRYKTALSSVNEGSIHRGQLEHLIHRDFFERLARLGRYDASREALTGYFLTKFEIDEILRLALFLNAGMSEKYIIDLPGFLISHASFDLIEFAKARDFDGMLSVLARTPYHKIIKEYTKGVTGGRIDFPALEHALYLYYCKTLFQKIDKSLSGAAKKDLKQLVATEIEMKNIAFLYRLKVFFRLSPDQIRQYLYPYAQMLSRRAMDNLIEAADRQALIEQLDEGKIGRRFGPYREDSIEHYINRALFRLNKRQMRFSTSPEIVFYTIMILFDIEKDNITNIIEGVRYALPPEEIKTLLIL